MSQPNILFILVDALRVRNLSCYGYSRSTSPNIDNLAREGIIFEKAFSCAVSTHPSLTSIFSGKYPMSHGIQKQVQSTMLLRQHIQQLNESGTIFLPEILKSEGYTTQAIDWLGRWFKRGFDYYSGIDVPRGLRLYGLIRESANLRYIRRIRDQLESPSLLQNFITMFHLPIFRKAKTVAKQNAQIVTDRAIDVIKRLQAKKFFLFIHYWDTHAPYNPPMQYTKEFMDDDDYGNDQTVEEILCQFSPKNSQYLRQFIAPEVRRVKEALARYDGAIAYVDHQIGRLIETLKNNGVLDKTFIVLTSDHGESLTEHRIYFEHHGLYDVTTNIPLIFRYSDLHKHKRVKSLVQLTDITPTLLDALDVKNRNLNLDGKSLLPLMFDDVDRVRDAVFMEEIEPQHKRAIRTENYKYICALSKESAICKVCNYVHGGMEELYDLNKDPEETSNIFEERPHETEELRKKLSECVKLLEFKRKKKILRKTVKTPLDYSDEEERLISERLRKLGYT